MKHYLSMIAYIHNILHIFNTGASYLNISTCNQIVKFYYTSLIGVNKSLASLSFFWPIDLFSPPGPRPSCSTDFHSISARLKQVV